MPLSAEAVARLRDTYGEPDDMSPTLKLMLEGIEAMLKPGGFDFIIVCCSNLAAENFWYVLHGFVWKQRAAQAWIVHHHTLCQRGWRARSSEFANGTRCRCAFAQLPD
eukprot:6186874-Pleurochrysis_carterae.AAC.3